MVPATPARLVPVSVSVTFAAVVGDSDFHGCERRLRVARSGHARAAHFREPAVDDCADCWHDYSAGPVRDTVVEKDEVLVSVAS